MIRRIPAGAAGACALGWLLIGAAAPGTPAAQGAGAAPGAPSLRIPRVEETLRRYAAAVRSLPADSIAAFYAEDGELLLPGMPALVGRKAIRDFLAPMQTKGVVDSTEMTSDYMNGGASCVSEWGTYRQVAGPKDGPHQAYVGRYSALWVLAGPDPLTSPWLLERLMMQPLPAPTAAAPSPAGAPPGGPPRAK